MLILFKDFSCAVLLKGVDVDDDNGAAITGNTYLQLLCNTSIFYNNFTSISVLV